MRFCWSVEVFVSVLCRGGVGAVETHWEENGMRSCRVRRSEEGERERVQLAGERGELYSERGKKVCTE